MSRVKTWFSIFGILLVLFAAVVSVVASIVWLAEHHCLVMAVGLAIVLTAAIITTLVEGAIQ